MCEQQETASASTTVVHFQNSSGLRSISGVDEVDEVVGVGVAEVEHKFRQAVVALGGIRMQRFLQRPVDPYRDAAVAVRGRGVPQSAELRRVRACAICAP